MDARPLVIVAGMHRSGTTLLMRGLRDTGGIIGEEGDLIPGAPSNPGGHFEIIRVARLNDDVLAATGQHWAGPLRVAETALADLAAGPLGDDARSVLARALSGVEFVKDPRFCLTLSFWRAVLPEKPMLVIPWRHPGEVAASLEARNGFPQAYGRLLWDEYHRRLLRDAHRIPRVLVSHRQIMSDLPSVLDHVRTFVGLPMPTDRSVGDPSPVRAELHHHESEEPLREDELAVLRALRDDGAVDPLPSMEEANRDLLFGSVAPMGIAHDSVRAKLVGHPRRLL